MKKFLICLLILFIRNSDAKIYQHDFQNGIRLIACDEFFLPVAKLGVIYSVGLNDFDNVCESLIIEEKLLSDDSKKSLQKWGANFSVNVYNDFSEITSVISPEKVADSIKIILENKSDLKNFDLLKSKLLIGNKLKNYFETNSIQNEIYSNINSKKIFNESLLKNLTKEDTENFFKKFDEAHIDIIVCGKVNFKSLVNEIKFLSLYPARKKGKIFSDDFKYPKKNIEMKGKFFPRSLKFIYKINNEKFSKNYSAILSVINFEIFEYLKKISLLIDRNYILENYQSPLPFLEFIFQIKKDVSLKNFEENYENFLKFLKKTEISSEKLQKIAKIRKFSEIDDYENLSSIYDIISKKFSFYKIPSLNISEKILKLNPTEIKNFVDEILIKNLILKITTQYKADI